MTGARAMRAIGMLLLLLPTLSGFGCGEPEREGCPVVVIGLDGATWDLLQPWIDAGELPMLDGLQQSAAWGQLQSVVPYLSPPAWTSAVTGVNPGKHAIFDFQRRVPGELTVVNETAKSRRAQPIWNMLNARGRRVLLLNIPMTDPPDAVAGLFVAGFPHPDPRGFTYPPELEEELADYPLDELEMKIARGEEDSLFAAYLEHLRVRKEIVLRWLREEPFDLLWAVFTGTDRMQHLFWKFTDPENPYYDPEMARRYGDAIHDFWIEQDAALGDILAAVGDEAAVLLLSDHGFGPLRFTLHLYNYVRRAESALTEREAAMIQSLDPNDACRLFVMRKGRDPGAIYNAGQASGVRERLIAELRKAADPRTGRAMCERVWTSEEVFIGTYAEKGPDLVVLPSDGYMLTLRADAATLEGEEYVGPQGPQLSGWHRMNGMYALRGPQTSPGKRDGEQGRRYSLLDVVPTILYLLGEPIPDGLDGALMRAVIDPAVLAERPPESSPPLDEDFRELTPEELRNLKNLPYIGG